MTRVLVVLLAVVLVAPAQARVDQAASARIEITATLEAIRSHAPGQRVRYLLLWNRQKTARPLGHAYLACVRGPQNVWVCTGIYTLPYGRIMTTGEVRSFDRHTQAVTAGTRSERAVRDGHPGYVGWDGTMATVRLGPGTYHINFRLVR